MDLTHFPLPFFLSLIALFGCSLYAWCHRDEGWGLPMGMVLGTTLVWYHGDALYNDYEQYRLLMGADALEAAWWQVTLFIGALAVLVPVVHRTINQKYLGRRSYLMLFVRTNWLKHPKIQQQLDILTKSMLAAWLVLMGIALLRVDFNFIGIFAPYLGEKVNPWSRGRMGGGIDALLSLAGYVQIFMTAGFGVVAAVAQNRKTRAIAIAICCLIFPFYLLDRTRNAMLATMLPGILAWIFLRLEGGLWKKATVLLIAFLAVNFWFAFVIANRKDHSIASAIHSDEAVERVEDVKHQGISMFSELGYMNDFMAKGTYNPNWGARYFAEAVNMVPRALWKEKPTIGIDYAIARGFGSTSVGEASGGITASISTGMIGQGVVNFGGFFGPIAAALLMSIWVSVLARQDLMGRDPARLLLYAIGMILTFNMGRDITLLVLYPYVFGWLLLLAKDWYDENQGKSVYGKQVKKPRRVG